MGSYKHCINNDTLRTEQRGNERRKRQCEHAIDQARPRNVRNGKIQNDGRAIGLSDDNGQRLSSDQGQIPERWWRNESGCIAAQCSGQGAQEAKYGGDIDDNRC